MRMDRKHCCWNVYSLRAVLKLLLLNLALSQFHYRRVISRRSEVFSYCHLLGNLSLPVRFFARTKPLKKAPQCDLRDADGPQTLLLERAGPASCREAERGVSASPAVG